MSSELRKYRAVILVLSNELYTKRRTSLSCKPHPSNHIRYLCEKYTGQNVINYETYSYECLICSKTDTMCYNCILAKYIKNCNTGQFEKILCSSCSQCGNTLYICENCYTEEKGKKYGSYQHGWYYCDACAS